MTPPARPRRVLVAGGAHGIGGAIVDRLATDGSLVACADVDLTAAGRRATRLAAAGATVVPLAMDVTDPTAVATAVEGAEQHLGGLDGLVYAAGVTATAPATEVSLAQWRRVLAVNLDGAFLVAAAVAPRLTTGGAVVFIGSQLASAAMAGKAAYIASKGGIEALTRALAVEWAPHGVRVVCLAPGPVRAGMLLDRLGDDPATLAAAAGSVPLGRLGDPSEIAGAACFLLSDDASFITGETLVADGGYRAW